jgi:hypothetical protein
VVDFRYSDEVLIYKLDLWGSGYTPGSQAWITVVYSKSSIQLNLPLDSLTSQPVSELLGQSR